MNVKTLFKDVSKDWLKVFTSGKLFELLKDVVDNLKKEEDITPPIEDIFNFARLTEYNSIRVIVLGQDPYPKKGDAHGLAFSSKSDKTPASLLNIYKCLEKQSLIKSRPSTSDLTHWASQGVLLLNSSLTTKIGQANAHANIWKEFTDELIKYISDDKNNVIFLLWGAYAQKKENIINKKCTVFKWLHPSPLAQNTDEDKKFINCTNFQDVNNEIKKENGIPICWEIEPEYIIYTDGACSNNGKKGKHPRAGYCVYFSNGTLKNNIYYGKVPHVQLEEKIVYGTNQRAEGLAIIVAIEEILSVVFNKVTIVTDSEFWINMIEKFMPSWDKKGVDFKEKKNSDLTIKLYSLIKKAKEKGKLEFVHINSHNKNPDAPQEHIEGNRIADEYAVKAKNLDSFDLIKTHI